MTISPQPTAALPLDLPDIDAVSSIIRDVAQRETLPYFRDLANAGVREKTGPGDLVTLADEAGERALTPRLMELLPGSTVLGEEAASVDPAVLDRVHGDAPVWIIDPVDGTINFANGRPLFAVIVALACRGETLAGWIHDPCDGRMATAVKGRGTLLNGHRVTVAKPVALGEMTGALSTRFCDPALGRQLDERGQALGPRVCLSSAAQEYLRLLEGRAHFSLYHRLMPWDHAAGVLMHAEAGGHSALFDGTPYRPTTLDGGVMLAPDQESWQALHHHLFG